MFGGYQTQTQVFTLDYDPGSDDYVALFRAPKKLTITGAYATVANDVSASTANYFSVDLVNGGSAGTATDAVAAAVGGTAGWTGLTPKSFTVSDGELDSGEILVLHYDETGTGTFTQLTVQVDYVLGEG